MFNFNSLSDKAKNQRNLFFKIYFTIRFFASLGKLKIRKDSLAEGRSNRQLEGKMRDVTILFCLVVVLAVSGCSTTRGAALGAIPGALIGAATGNAGKGALVGAGIGAAIGAVDDMSRASNYQAPPAYSSPPPPPTAYGGYYYSDPPPPPPPTYIPPPRVYYYEESPRCHRHHSWCHHHRRCCPHDHNFHRWH